MNMNMRAAMAALFYLQAFWAPGLRYRESVIPDFAIKVPNSDIFCTLKVVQFFTSAFGILGADGGSNENRFTD